MCPEQWKLTRTGANYLLADDDHPHHWGGIFVLIGENYVSPLGLLEAIRKEQTAPVIDNSDAMMEHVMDEVLALKFAKHMHSQGAAAAVEVAKHPAFRSAKRVLDVAGGAGTYALEIAKQNSHLEVGILELSSVEKIANQWSRMARLGSRVKTVKGNMFLAGDWPAGKYDLILFSHVLHDWDEKKIRLLLRNAFNALPPGGKLILHEILVRNSGAPHQIATAFSATLYRWTEGRQYKASELTSLLRATGFVVAPDAIASAHGPSSLLVASKPTFSAPIIKG